MVDADGTYRGGVIAPGINLSLEALYNAAARLPGFLFQKQKLMAFNKNLKGNWEINESSYAFRNILGLYRLDRRYRYAHQT